MHEMIALESIVELIWHPHIRIEVSEGFTSEPNSITE